jgi:hypothetical protein
VKPVAIIVAAFLIVGCTIAPKVSGPSKPSPWAQANIIGYDSSGYFVRKDWIRVYHGLLAKYESKLPVNEQVAADDMTGIDTRGAIFHVTFATNKTFTDLQRFENEAGP